MTQATVSILNKIAATGLAVAVSCMAYAGFVFMFENTFLAALVGAVVGGFTLGRMYKADREAAARIGS